MSNEKLQQYGIVMSYLAYENTVYWGRANFFLLASAALLGFMANILIPNQSEVRLYEMGWSRAITILLLSGAGLFLCHQWKRALQTGEFWIFHWHRILEDLEKDAFGEVCLLRKFDPPKDSPPFIRARPIARHTLYLFYVLWTIAIIYSVVVIFVKVSKSCLILAG